MWVDKGSKGSRGSHKAWFWILCTIWIVLYALWLFSAPLGIAANAETVIMVPLFLIGSILLFFDSANPQHSKWNFTDWAIRLSGAALANYVVFRLSKESSFVQQVTTVCGVVCLITFLLIVAKSRGGT